MTPEGKVKAVVKRVLKDMGAYYHFPVQNGMGSPCLDCHGCFRGLYFAIETKAPGKKPTARQQITIDAIRKAGGLALVVDNSDYVTVKECLEFQLWTHQCSSPGLGSNV